jgi:uncharacterized protein (TIGR02611 family)
MQWVSAVKAALGELPSAIRKLIVGVIGVTILIVGIAMIVLPGPALILIPVGVGLLATEFAWARWIVRRARHAIAKARSEISRKSSSASTTR